MGIGRYVGWKLKTGNNYVYPPDDYVYGNAPLVHFWSLQEVGTYR